MKTISEAARIRLKESSAARIAIGLYCWYERASKVQSTRPLLITCDPMELLGLSKIGFMSVSGSTPAAKACHACARLISPPPVATTLFNDIFCGLKGETRSPARFAKRHKPATIVLLPALEAVP